MLSSLVSSSCSSQGDNVHSLLLCLSAAITYAICMQWVKLADFGRLEIALCSTTVLRDHISSTGPLHALSCETKSGQSSTGYYEWAVRRQISAQSVKLKGIVVPSTELARFFQFSGGGLTALDLHVEAGCFINTGVEIASHCPHLQTLELHHCNVGTVLQRIFDGCSSLQIQ
jgi:hypothetical protein